MSRPPDLVQGTLDALILQTVALEPLHGLAVAQRLRARSADVLRVSQGSLYPALHRMEQEGWLQSSWLVTEKGRKAKMYELTDRGRAQLATEKESWDRLTRGVSRVLRYT